MEIKNKLIFYLKKIEHPTFNSILNLVMLLVAICALIIAIRTLNSANNQFERNSKSADSLFNVQLSYSKQLNDSLINQISKLQEITNNQLKITDEQLKVSKEIYADQLYSGRPKIVLISNTIKDTSFVITDTFSPIITTKYSNVGNRNALNLRIRNFIVYPDFSSIRSNAGYSKQTEIFEPEAVSETVFKPKIILKYKQDFYYCVEFTFYDFILKRKFNFPYYFHYYKNRNEFNFYSCNDYVKPKIKDTINKILGEVNKPLFDN